VLFKANLETQNLRPPKEEELIFSAYDYQKTEVMGVNLVPRYCLSGPLPVAGEGWGGVSRIIFRCRYPNPPRAAFSSPVELRVEGRESISLGSGVRLARKPQRGVPGDASAVGSHSDKSRVWRALRGFR
jgi:hypothetical protein